MDKFEYAFKNKLRYNTPVGFITTEDLYDLPLDSAKKVSLNSVAKSVNNEIKASEEESFVTTATTKNTEAQIKLDIIKHIIKDRLEENKAKQDAAANKARRELIASIIEEKQNSALKELTLEELQAELTR